MTGSAAGANTASAASGGSSSAAASPNAATTRKGVGLKVWIGVVGLGALGVLAL